MVDGDGDAEEEDEDDEGVGPDLFRMDQAGCQFREVSRRALTLISVSGSTLVGLRTCWSVMQ